MTAVTVRTINSAEAIAEMRRLLADYDYWEKREELFAQREKSAFAHGYKLGFRAAYDIAYTAAEYDLDESWRLLAAKIRAMASTRTFAEVLKARGLTPEQHRRNLGRDRYPLPDRECPHCHGRGLLPGGVA